MSEPVELPPGAPLAALGAVILLDALLSRLPTRPLSGVVDEAAHLATGTIVLAAWPAPSRSFARGLAAGSVLIDVDHVPELWGRARWLRPRGVRPLPHTLATPALVAALGRNRVTQGAAIGLLAHLGRDLATGRTSVALLWPLTRRPFSIRYRTYVAALALLALRPARREVRAGSGSAPPPRASHPGSPPPTAPAPAPDPRPGSGEQ